MPVPVAGYVFIKVQCLLDHSLHRKITGDAPPAADAEFGSKIWTVHQIVDRITECDMIAGRHAQSRNAIGRNKRDAGIQLRIDYRSAATHRLELHDPKSLAAHYGRQHKDVCRMVV